MKTCLKSSCKRVGRLLIVCVLLALVSSVSRGAQRHEPVQHASELWEQAIAAKGGRERLRQVRSLLISYEETSRNFFGAVVHRGHVERLYAFPGKSWVWDDGLPLPFKLTVHMLNIERNLTCTVRAGSATPSCHPATAIPTQPDELIEQVQYLYLMETQWVKPEPVEVFKKKIGLKTIDVVRTRVGSGKDAKKVDYYLDRKTHLPQRVAVFYSGSGDRPTITFDFSDYVDVNGIQMPGKQKKGKINFQINPAYDEDIFTRPPSVEAGPKAWQSPAR